MRFGNDVLTVVVVAHPDDESMFFLPSVFGIKKEPDANVWLLCLTTGNYDGLGKIRSKELYRTGREILGLDRLLLCDDAEIQDHPRDSWDIARAATLIETTLQDALTIKEEEGSKSTTTTPRRYSNIQIVTFDYYGVSGHVNHRDTFLACLRFCSDHDRFVASVPSKDRIATVEMWTLESESSLIFKYFPIMPWIRLFLSCFGLLPPSYSSSLISSYGNRKKSDDVIYFYLHLPLLNWRAMASHASQFVWYRRLFVVFCCYTYTNKLRRQRNSC